MVILHYPIHQFKAGHHTHVHTNKGVPHHKCICDKHWDLLITDDSMT